MAVHGAIQRTLWFEGRVQGVGFRYTTCGVATQFDVTGYVRNLADGRVEVVAEGEPREIERFTGAVCDAMRGYVTSTQQQDAPPTGGFSTFGVRY